MQAGKQVLFGREIDVSNVDKVFFPDAQLTKGDVVDYYRRVAETMLPYLKDRPVALKRYPDGIESNGFFQKDAGEHFPGWLRREDVPKREGGTLDHVVVDEPATIVYLADQATIEPHVWLSRADDLERPDQLVFDLDPPDDDVDRVRRAARRVRDVLAEVGLNSLVKTSGSAGYHVHVALDRSHDFSEGRRFGARMARLLAARYPEELTDRQRKTERHGRVFIDYLRNAYGQTSIAAYAVRARPGAPVATPLDWEEIGRTDPRSYTIGNIFRRLGQREDPWRDAWQRPENLTAADRRLDELLSEADQDG